MTQETQFWTDERIKQAIAKLETRDDVKQNAYWIAEDVRDSYERDRKFLLAELDRLRQQVTELTAQVGHWQQQHAECTTSLITEVRKTERLTAQLAAASGWEPVPTGYVIDTLDGELIEIMAHGSTINIIDEDDCHGYILPDDIRLCRLSPQPQQQGLDFPDSPGWWAFEGKWTDQEHDKVWQYVFLVEEKEGVLYAVIANDLELPSTLIGKWFRLYMPWDKEANNV